ncbi:MAG: hypothetical protein ABIS06_20755 [Vicinamibacterales bacterium]
MTAVVLALALIGLAGGSATSLQDHQHQTALKERGNHVMGFDQDATTHHFILADNGGRIEVTAKAADDTTSMEQVRGHLQHIAQMFGEGDFSAPALVHDQKVPGVAKMKAAGTALTYTYEALPRGARIKIAGSTPEAISAVHEFLKFQIKDHGTGDPTVVR